MKFFNIQIEARIALLYAIFGGLWILFSDSILNILVPDRVLYVRFQTYKGWGFVIVSAILIFYLIKREIASRMDTVEKLHASEEALRRFELISEHSRDLILFMRRDDGRLLDANAAAIQVYGYSRDELLGLSIRDLRAPDTLGLTADQMAQADNGGILFETVHRRKDGSTFPVEVSSQGASVGGVRTLVSIVRDITVRKHVEGQVRYQAALLSNVNDAIIASDAQFRLTAWNSAAESMYGWKAEEVIGCNGLEIIKTEWPEKDANEMRRVIAETGRWIGEATQMRRDGSRFPVEVSSMVLYDDSGQVTGYISVNRDITERKQAESQRQFLYETLNASLNEIYLFDARTLYFEFVSEGALKNIGYSLEKLLQMTPLDLKPDYTPDSFETLIAPLRRQEVRAINFESRHRRANGSLYPVDVHLQLFVQAGRQVFLAIILDTTERKRAEEELQRTLKELKRSNEELEQFAYVASHDLQEPLRGIAGLVQLLGQRYQGKLDSRADEYISHIIDGTQRMQTLINDLLAYSRVGRHGEAIQTTSAEAALRATLNNLSAAIREYRATVTYDSLPSVRADATQLIQLFQNLIGNAIKFHSERPPQIHISAADAGDCWQFSVSDNGIGIEPQFFERIFQVFQRLHTRREYQGTGIGLAICKKIIDRHGGQIWVASQPGAGSTFYFTLPKGRNE